MTAPKELGSNKEIEGRTEAQAEVGERSRKRGN